MSNIYELIDKHLDRLRSMLTEDECITDEQFVDMSKHALSFLLSTTPKEWELTQVE